MVKKKMKSKSNKIPGMADVHVVISYNVLYDDYNTVNPHTFIKDIPTLPMLNFVIKLQNQVMFSISDTSIQRQMIKDMCPMAQC